MNQKKEIEKWTPYDVVDHLEELGLGIYRESFLENFINGEVIPLLTEAHLKSLGMTIIGHRITFLHFMQSINSGDRSSSQSNNKASNSKLSQKREENPTVDDYSSSKSRKSDMNVASIPDDYDKVSSSDDMQKSNSSNNWEKKRRQALLKKMGSVDNETKKSSAKPDMDFGNAESSTGLFGNPPPMKTKKFQSSSDEKTTEKFVVDPNPFSREDESNYPPIPKKKPATKPPPKKKEPVNVVVSKREIEEQNTRISIPEPVNTDPWESEDDSYPPPMNNSSRQSIPAEADDDGERVECSYCARRFHPTRINKHEEACARAQSRKKKVFDSSKMRLNGTDAAKYAGKTKKEEPPVKKSNYKQAHEQLIESLRAARKYTQYEKDLKEGKAVGPAPTLPKVEIAADDRVDCPHCGRKFSKDAAQKHIPVCERMSGNKWKSTTAKGRR